MEFRNKTIVILSQQDWGEMFISKNHYALELAKLGNKVFYVPGPEKRRGLKTGEIRISNLAEHQNLFYVDHCLFFPGILKFKARWLYDALVRLHINRLIRQTGNVDIVLSFDLSNSLPLKCFPSSSAKIYMPVDELNEKTAVAAAKSADIIFSITHEILSKFSSLRVPRIFINHGVSKVFINENIAPSTSQKVNVGMSGNFLRPDIDRTTLLDIIQSNPNVIFNLYGSAGKTVSNITPNVTADAAAFVAELERCRNVILHGSVAPNRLAEEFKKMDCFLICYDIQKDQSKGTNYHKILEYLASGKVVISTNVTTYNNFPGMIEMIGERYDNGELPTLFKRVISNLPAYNSIQKQMERINFAKQFTYNNQIRKIETELSALPSKK